MKNFLLALALSPALLAPHIAQAAPRDAVATLNRCGAPLLGDETIFENTLAGGRRILKYERGTLYFDKVAKDGWTFRYGVHRSQTLSAAQMAPFMPCLVDALADSASSAPIHSITSVDRVEVSLKRAYQSIVIYTLVSLGFVGAILFFLGKRSSSSEGVLQ